METSIDHSRSRIQGLAMSTTHNENQVQHDTQTGRLRLYSGLEGSKISRQTRADSCVELVICIAATTSVS